MTIIIKGFEMPKNCKECEFNNHCGDCLAGALTCDYKSETRPNKCPLMELSETEKSEG